MRTRAFATTLLLIVFSLNSILVYSQVPQGFSYQAVIRDGSGNPIVEKTIGMKITLQNALETALYTETHSPKTSKQGVITINIGAGIKVGSNAFTSIPWKDGDIFIKVEIDPAGNTAYTPMGVPTRLQSVPYAMFAAGGNPGPQGPVGPLVAGTNGQTLRNDGTTWVASDNIFNNGTNVGVGTNTPLYKLDVNGDTRLQGNLYDKTNSLGLATKVLTGGAAGVNWKDLPTLGIPSGTGLAGQVAVWNGANSIQGLANLTWASTTNGSSLQLAKTATDTDDPIFEVKNRDGKVVFGVYQGGVRIFVDDSPTKSARGGFAVGGLTNSGKGTSQRYFSVTPDSTRIFINDSIIPGKSARGGFAVGGLTNSGKTAPNEFMSISIDKARIYIDTSLASKSARGGFAVGGLTNSGKGGKANDYFNISGNSELEKVNSEARILWYPVKAAFLAGEVHIGSADSVGTNSTSLGYRTIAMGNYSQAMGYKAQSLGLNSTAIGNNAIANSNNSFAFGNYAQTQGLNSFAFGDSAISNGDDSYAMGAHAQALGKNSFAMGSFGINAEGFLLGPPVASGDYSYAFGMGVQASGKHSIAMGNESTSTAGGSIAIGRQNNATGPASLALGNYNNASGIFSTAIGNATIASELNATALGCRTSASGESSTAIGKNSIASATNSIAMGLFNTASGGSSLALGNYTNASGTFSTTMGNATKATGANSTALGSGIEAQGTNTFGIGISMVTDVITDNNTMAIMGGEVGIGTVSPDKLLHVAGDARIEGDIYYGVSGSTTKYTKPDFVFLSEYSSYFEPLKVDEFIKANGHLPWFTKGSNEKEGINLTRMQFETVETVENLQLQIIALKKDHQEQIVKQQSEIDNLKSELEVIKALLKK